MAATPASVLQVAGALPRALAQREGWHCLFRENCSLLGGRYSYTNCFNNCTTLWVGGLAAARSAATNCIAAEHVQYVWLQ